jgi:hypothetical protein
VLKLIYERPFRSWLKDQGAEVISGWIDRATARATALVGCKEYRVLFESDQGFDRVFSRALSEETDRHIPRRRLREIMRFGHMPLLKTITGGKKIDDATIGRVFAMESAQGDRPSKIAVLQHRREDLHDEWVKKKHLEAVDLQTYCETLGAISEHRRDSTFVNLVDHVRVHRTIMTVLGRLVDYVACSSVICISSRSPCFTGRACAQMFC